MNRLLLIIFFGIGVLQSDTMAQDYQLFFTNRMYTYEFEYAGQSHFTVFKADTFQLNG